MLVNGPGPDFTIHGKSGRRDRWPTDWSVNIEGSMNRRGPWTKLGKVKIGSSSDLSEELPFCLYFRLTCNVDDFERGGDTLTPALRIDAIEALNY